MNVDFIAEVSSNHHRDIERCFEFIDTSAAIGCQAVKFQLFKIKELFAPQILAKSETHRAREAWELPVEFLPDLARRCREKGIKFSCTPFYLGAVTELEPHVDFYKIASYELMWDDLLIACAATGKPVVLSTGMANLNEIRHAVGVVRKSGGKNLTLLQCVSGYPAPVAECNLAAIETLRSLDVESVGWSDHSVNAGVIYRAIHRWNASMIEFHLDLDGTGDEFKTGHCWLPEPMKGVIRSVNDGFIADGSGVKRPSASEVSDRDWRADPSDGLRPLKPIREEWR